MAEPDVMTFPANGKGATKPAGKLTAKGRTPLDIR